MSLLLHPVASDETETLASILLGAGADEDART
jgi:hypothetical protein